MKRFVPKLRRGWFVSLASFALLIAAGGLAGCSGENGASIGQPCEVDSDCANGLFCRANADGDNICVLASSNGSDAGDGGEDGMTQDYEKEDYFISFPLEQASATGASDWSFRIIDTSDGTESTLTGGEVDCDDGQCWLSRDMTTFAYTKDPDPNDAVKDVYTLSVSESGDGFELDGSHSGATTLVAEADDISQSGNHLMFTKSGTAYHIPISGQEGDETPIGPTNPSPLNDWYVDAAQDTSIYYDTHGETMDVFVGNAQGEATQEVYTYDCSNFQQRRCSGYSSGGPTAVSSGGEIIAVALESPNRYGNCESDSDCTGAAQKCGVKGECTRYDVAVHFFDTNSIDELGAPCGGEGTCGDIHECYQPGDGTADAVCVPGRVVVGIPTVGQQDGCDDTSNQLDTYPYTEIGGPLTFDGNGNVYAVGIRDCTVSPPENDPNYEYPPGTSNMPQSDIIRINPEQKTFEPVHGFFGEAHSTANCYDPDESEFTPDSCKVYIESARISPGGNEFAYTGTNITVGQEQFIDEHLHLWRVLRDGTEGDFLGTQNSLDIVKSFQVHAP